jgi:glycosyltransferase involved in cell wall biosynthesis
MNIMILSSHTSSLFWFRSDMMKEIVEKGHNVFAVGNEDDPKWTAWFKEEGITYRSIRVERNGLNPINDIRTLIDIYHLIKEIKPDRIFAYQAKTVIYGSYASYLAKVPQFYPLIAGLGSVFIGKGIKHKVIRTIMKIEYRMACKNSAKVFFHNHDDRDEFIKSKLIDSRKAIVINGSGVNLEKFVPTPLPERIAFLFIGRLIRDKGILEYLKACELIKQTYPEVRCLLVGPYDSNPSSIKAKTLDHYVKNGIIEYFGEQSDVRPYISQCSVFVLPSYHEGTPKTILEAMAMGRPIITTNAPGCRETVLDSINGYLVKTHDQFDIYAKMRVFIENPSTIEPMGRRSIEITKEKYDVHKVNQVLFREMEF